MIKIEDIIFRDSYVQIVVNELLKQSRPGYHLPPLILEVFCADKNLCVGQYLRQYILRMKDIQGSVQKLFISYQEPHNGETRESIARWNRTILTICGVNKKMFKSASLTRAAKFAPLETVFKRAGWSNDCMFRKF